MNSGGNDSLILKGKQRQHPAPEGEPSLKEGRNWGVGSHQGSRQMAPRRT